ncbi:hypothetical protein AVEN_177518-1 [Araneus ventricosus]|uniref:Uncharacterized protein n=1 Tax=Araneus ventricosus TaxID=182803 RepID=A0A4Y2Q2L9_ARAVE|nr:hypothetical protein AVEN_177518-1 [Araneus ventricosus]
MEAPFQPHYTSLQSPGVTEYTPPPAFKTGIPVPLSREIFTLPPLFCGFRFSEKEPLTFSRILFQFHGRMRQMENNHRIIASTTSFGTRCSKWCEAERS